jgi:hypothetical protein
MVVFASGVDVALHLVSMQRYIEARCNVAFG